MYLEGVIIWGCCDKRRELAVGYDIEYERLMKIGELKGKTSEQNWKEKKKLGQGSDYHHFFVVVNCLKFT
jgi:hypothetical protein